MKKILFTMGCLLLMATSQAQENDDTLVYITQETSIAKSNKFNIDARFVEDGFGIGAHTNWFEPFQIGLYFDYFKTGEYLASNQSFGFYLGAVKTYWFTDFLFAEGLLGLGYDWHSWSTKLEFSGTSDSENNIFFYLSPRVGAKLFTINKTKVCLTAGYRFEFLKFKFSKDYRKDFFTVGVSLFM